MPYTPGHGTDDCPPKDDGILEQVLVEASYHSPSSLLPPPPPPQPHSIQSIKMPPLTEERFMDAFMLFSSLTGIRLNEQDFFVQGHQINPWELYRTVSLRNGFDSVTMNGEWPMVGVDLGFHPVSGGDPHSLTHCTPAVAHQLHQLYQDTLRHFDQAYSRGILNQLEYLQTTGQGQPQALQRQYQLLAYQPTEADYQALLSTIAASESLSVMTFEEAKNILVRFCDVPTDELETHRVPQHVIAYVEHNRKYLKWLAQNRAFCASFTPTGSPQVVHRNLLNDVQTIPRPSPYSPQNHPQLRQRHSDWESIYGDAVNLSLPQQQIILALRAQVQQGNMTHKQALDRLAMMQASAHAFQEQSAPQQLPLGFNAGGVPSGNAHQQVDALSQHAQVSTNDQMNILRRPIQTQDRDASHLRQFNMHIGQDPQPQSDSGLTSRIPSNPNPLRAYTPQDSQGPGVMQENFPPVSYANIPSSSAPSASQPPPRPHPANSIYDVPLPQLRALSTQLLHVVIEGENQLQTTSSPDEGDIQRQQLRAKIELNKQRLRALHEVINMKMRPSGDLTQRAVNGPAQSMGTLSTPHTGVQITGSVSTAGAQNHPMPVSMSPTFMSGIRSSSIFTQSPSVSQIRRPTQEDLFAARRWIEEKKRMAFSSVPNFDRVPSIPSIPECDIQEYQRNLGRLDQVLINIEKYIHFAFAALKKEEVVGRLFKMMASAKCQIEELKRPNPRYLLELHTIRGMIQEADNMDKGLKAVLQRIQAQTMPRDGVSSAPQPPPRLDSILILPPPTSSRDSPQWDDLEPARSLEGAMSHCEGLFDEEVRIAMNKLKI